MTVYIVLGVANVFTTLSCACKVRNKADMKIVITQSCDPNSFKRPLLSFNRINSNYQDFHTGFSVSDLFSFIIPF